VVRKLDHFLRLYKKINSKWIKDLNVRTETIELLRKNIASKLLDTGLGNVFMVMSPQARETKAKIKYWEYIKIKSFCTVKEAISKMKRQHTEWKKVFTNDVSEDG